MESFEIQPLLPSAIPDVASFLRNWHVNRDQDLSVQSRACEDTLSVERRLQWLLVENPLAVGASQHGFCVRNACGLIAGIILSFPGGFLSAEKRLLGLCSGGFFVEPQARMQGFYLFKRYLSSPGYHFFFGTTCNANSGALWNKLGGCAVPGSEAEYILPLNLDVMLPAILADSTPSGFRARIARAFGRCTSPIMQLLTRKSPKMAIEASRDWDKLSELSRRHRPANTITTDRSAAFLQWRYGENSPNHRSEICLFRDTRGNEGWFCFGNTIRGRQGQIRGRILLDAIWPRQRIGFRDIFLAILQLAASDADAIFFLPRPGLDYGECSRFIIRRKLEGPQVFAVAPKGSTPLAFSSLDLVPADGDSGFLISAHNPDAMSAE